MSCYVYVHALIMLPPPPTCTRDQNSRGGAKTPVGTRCYLRSELVLHSCSIDNIIPSDRRYILSMVVGA